MKRVNLLFDAILDRANLRRAFLLAAKAKQDRPEVRAFAKGLDANLDRIAGELHSGAYMFGRVRQFVIHDPKERLITAPCFEERVVHHAVLAVCGPVLDRWLLPDSFACRVGKGREAAVARSARFARRHGWFLKFDVRKYFDSVRHDRLLELLARRIKDRRVLDLFGRIVGAFRGELGRGLPIGSLTSQHLANFHLGWFDRVVKERWRVPGYVRYMDDMALWFDDRGHLRRVERDAPLWLKEHLDLDLKPAFSNRTRAGMDFLGCRVFPDRVTPNRRSRVRFRRKLRELHSRLDQGVLSEREFQERATALVAFVRAAGARSWRTRTAVIDQLRESVDKARTG